MSFTYDPTNDIGKVRLLIADTSSIPPGPSFQDADIQGFLDLEGENVLLAAADACDALAAKIAQTLAGSGGRGQKVQIGNYSVYTQAGQTAYDAFITQAKNLRCRASGENDPAFLVAEQSLSSFNTIDMLRNWALANSPLESDIGILDGGGF